MKLLIATPGSLPKERTKAGVEIRIGQAARTAVFVTDGTVVKELIATFETDWAQTGLGRERETERHNAVETVTLAAAARS
jgi:hypothetical protein